MLTDTDDDFFFEEDKMSPSSDEILPLLINIEENAQQQHCQQTSQEFEQHECKDSDDSDNAIVNQRTTTPTHANVTSLDVSDMETTVICAGQDHVEKLSDLNRQKNELERLGMTVTTSSVVITKDQSNLIGISIGGGAPMCPCLYIVQVFDGTPAARQGALQSGDELLAVNSVSVKGKTKVEVAKMIQATSTDVTIHYNKLHADPEQGKSLDIILKKLKHRLVDAMSSNTADTLGLSRAILCNDSLVKRLEELEGTELMYKGLVEHARRMLKAYYDLLQTNKSFGDVFTQISVREPQQRASEAFRMFGEFHRNLEKDGVKIIKQIKPILDDMGTYLNKAIPDTKMTVRRYADAKFTYLSYCLKVKEMDDEEHGFAALQEPLYRVETGNYEYRLILRCRQEARSKFAKLRTDVLEKMELLEAKHATDLNKQLHGLLDNLAQLNKSIVDRIEALPTLFPIELEFKETDFQYKSSTLKPQDMDDDDEDCSTCSKSNISSEIICGQEALEQPADIVNVTKQQLVDHQNHQKQQEDKFSTGLEDMMDKFTISPPLPETDNSEALLKELGLFGIDLNMSQAMATSNAAATAQIDICNFDLFLNQTIPTTTTQLEKDLMAANSCEMDLLLQ